MRWDPADLRLPPWLAAGLDRLVGIELALGRDRLAATRGGWTLIGVVLGVWAAALYSGNNLLYLCAAMLLAFALHHLLAARRMLARIDPTPLRGASIVSPGIVRTFPHPPIPPIVARFHPQPTGETAAPFEATLIGGETAAWRLVAHRRGRVRWRRAIIETASPGGIFRWRRMIDHRGEWIAPPAPAHAAAARWQAATAGGDGFHDLRRYAAGDPPQRIHWRRSPGDDPRRWMVKRFAAEADATALTIDLRLHGRPLEALEALLGLAWALALRGELRRLVVGDAIAPVDPADLRPAARLLADARPSRRPPPRIEGRLLSLAAGGGGR